MIKNTNISLDKDSKQRREAREILKYTLLLDYEPVGIGTKEDTYLDKVIKNTIKCCKGFFESNSDTVYNFFGSVYTANPKELLFLNRTDLNMKKGDDVLIQMIVQNAIMSSYHAILTEYLQHFYVTGYALENFKPWCIPYDSIEKGKLVYDTQNNKEVLKFDTKGISREKNDETNKDRKNSERSSVATRFNSAFNSRYKELKELSFLIIENPQETKINYHFEIQYAQLSKLIRGIPIKEFRFLSKGDSFEEAEQQIESLEELIKKFIPKISSEEETVDQLYCRYISERVFNLNAIKQILIGVGKVEKDTNYRFHKDDITQVLSKFLKLPNVFSRTTFIKFAFDHIDENVISALDYWQSHNIKTKYVMAEKHKFHKNINEGESKKGRFQFVTWLEQVELFVQYFTEYIFPFVDWCFVNLLMEGIEAEGGSYQEHLLKALKILGKYMKKNYASTILKPFDSCIVDRNEFSKEEKELLRQYFMKEERKSTIKELFVSSSDVELNLIPKIIQEFKNTNTPIKFVRDFYIDYLELDVIK